LDILEKTKTRMGALGQYYEQGHGYFFFPKLEGRISNRMVYRGKERLVWSLNNYLGLADHPEVRKADAEAAAEWGLAYPMGARMMSGHTKYHEQLERELAEFVKKPAVYLLNYGYQGMISIIDALLDRHDVVVYDSDCHACILDGLRMHMGNRFTYKHNDMELLDKNLDRATKLIARNGNKGGILVITEGVYGMVGDTGKLDEIVKLKKKYDFRLLVDDAHGFGTMGPTGAGTGEYYGVQDGVDVYFATFAKAMAGIGAFVASEPNVIKFLMYNMRSQVYAKSLPMPMVIGSLKRLELIRKHPEFREQLWKIRRALEEGLKKRGFNLGKSDTPVVPVYLFTDLPQATQLIYDLRENFNLFCSVVIYPVVPKGTILIRIIPTAVHTMEDVEYTLNAFTTVSDKIRNNIYEKDKFAEIPKG
jgi:glycine C-acetyltransferase